MAPDGPGSKQTLLFLVGELGLGGSERQLFLVLKHLDKRRFDCHVVVFNRSPYVVLNDALRAEGVQVWEVPPACRSVWRRLRYLYDLARNLRPDVVHSWTAHDNPYAGLIGRIVGAKAVLGSLRNLPALPGFRDLPVLYRLLALRSVPKLVVNTATIAEALTAGGYPASRVVVIPNGVELPVPGAAAPDLADLGIRDDHRVVGIVGNLRRVKNHELFVEAMAQVVAAHPQARGLIVGQPVASDPEQPEHTAAAIRAFGLEQHVILAGFRADVPALMQRFAVFCLTSTSEGMPNVILEAMAAARPVVATRVGGVAELVADAESGFLVEKGDSRGFAAAVSRLLADPARARQMGERGREIARRRFSCERAAARFAELYRGLPGEEGSEHTKPEEAYGGADVASGR